MEKVILVDQAPIGRTPRSNPASYVKAFEPIRKAFACARASRRRGYTASTFSFFLARLNMRWSKASSYDTVLLAAPAARRALRYSLMARAVIWLAFLVLNAGLKCANACSTLRHDF